MSLVQTPVLNPWDVLASMWHVLRPILPILLLILAVRVTLIVLRTQRWARAGLPEIDRMSGRDFEEKIAQLFRRKGYQVEVTPYVGDWGADLVIADNGRRTVVQAKGWKKRVSPGAVQEAVASKAKHNCQDAMVVTNSYFTPAAQELARVNRVDLWNRERLARELLAIPASSAAISRNVPEGIQPSPETPVPDNAAGDAWPRSRPKCYKCGREMVLKENTRGKFWACSGFPQCKHTFPARL